jgi:O-Antigen ligase
VAASVAQVRPPTSEETAAPVPGAATLLILVALAAAAVGHGGHYRRIAEICGALLAVAGVLVVARYRSETFRTPRWALLGIGVMIASTALTGLVDGHMAEALAPISLLAGLAVIVAGTAALPAPSRRQLADLVLALGAFLAATAWIGVAFHLEPLGHPDGGLWRAATTVTYANAAAAILGPLALWGLARTTTSKEWSSRMVVVLLVCGLTATLSRAGIASFIVGLAVLILMLGFQALWRGGGLAVVGGLIAAAALAPGMPADHHAEPWWAVLGLTMGVSLGMVSPTGRTGPGTLARPRRKLWIAALALVLLGAGMALMGLASHNRLWSGRVSVSSPDRSSLASVALQMWLQHPVTGVGPERAIFLWTAADGRPVFDRYAHDEYLQLAVEQGAVGLMGLAGLGLAVAATVREGGIPRRRHDQSETMARALRAGAIAGLVCMAVHSGFDFLWHVPAVVMVAALAVGLAAPLPRAQVLHPQPREQEET